MNAEEKELVEEFSAAFKKAIMKVSREELMCFLEAANYHELNKLDVRVLPDFIGNEGVVFTEPMPEISDFFAQSDPEPKKSNLNTLLGGTPSLSGLAVVA